MLAVTERRLDFAWILAGEAFSLWEEVMMRKNMIVVLAATIVQATTARIGQCSRLEARLQEARELFRELQDEERLRRERVEV